MKTHCHGRTVLEKDRRKVIDCESCGYIHVFPMYTDEELEKYYENVFSESTPSYLWFEKVRNIKKWKDRGSVLDIGCWEGTQLEAFLKDGWECTGTELNKKAAAVAAAKGIDVHQISIKEFFEKFRDKKWDVINVAYILEHIPEPAGFLALLKRNLKKGGIVIIEVPNEFSPFQMAYLKEHKLEPYWIALPDHVNYFDRKGIETLMKRAGWKVVHGETSFPMEMFLLMGDNYLKDREVGRRSFKKVVEMERILRTYEPSMVSGIYSALYKLGIGRSLVLYATRADDER